MILKSAKHPIQKRSFLLLELLISLALIALCFFPLIKPHTLMRKADISYLEEIQLERVAQAAFCHIKERLYENRVHQWENLCRQDEGKLDEPFFISLETAGEKQLTCHYTTQCLDKVNKRSQNKMGLLIEISMHFSPTLTKKNPYVRTLYLEQCHS